MEKLCINCLNPMDGAVCSHCGYPERSRNDPHQLCVGTMLRGRFQVGKVLGQGGFGITYLGRDTLMETTVAIKEFYPSGIVTRKAEESPRVECLTEKMVSHYDSSKERFLREARALVKFQDISQVVDILDFVEENNTAYIVMEYVRGVDLAKYIRNRGGCLSVQETFRILRPVMEALAAVHKAGIVHRDISPDNIILDPMGGAKLLDFGAVRTVDSPDPDAALAKSTEAILKHGFAPIEQYNSRGSLGPWTDEYAMCATIWYCLTGRIPEDAAIRVSDGVDPDWRSIPGLSPRQCAALEKGSAVRAKDRYPDMDSLIDGLFGEEPRLPEEGKPSSSQQLPAEPTTKKKGKKWPVVAAALLLVLAVLTAGLLFPKPEEKTVSRSPELSDSNPVEPPAPPQKKPEETAPEAEREGVAVRTGLAVVARASDSKSASGGNEGEIIYDVTLAAVMLDDASVITSCRIDEISARVRINGSGMITSDVVSPVLTKAELGADYGMVAWGGAVAEWDEQVAAFCDYAVGKTVEELRRGAIDENGYAKSDCDLVSSATIYLGGFTDILEAAAANAQYLGAQAGDELTLVTINSTADSCSAAAAVSGKAMLRSSIGVVTSRDGVITSCIIDALQKEVSFDASGTILSDVSSPVLTNNQMGESYGMKAYGGAIAEWHEQAAAFADYVTGKTAGEVAGIAVNERSAPAEADLISSVTISIADFRELIFKALE